MLVEEVLETMVRRRRLGVPPGLPVPIESEEEDAETEASVVVECLLHVGDWEPRLLSWSSIFLPTPSFTSMGRFLEGWDSALVMSDSGENIPSCPVDLDKPR